MKNDFDLGLPKFRTVRNKFLSFINSDIFVVAAQTVTMAKSTARCPVIIVYLALYKVAQIFQSSEATLYPICSV